MNARWLARRTVAAAALFALAAPAADLAAARYKSPKETKFGVFRM